MSWRLYEDSSEMIRLRALLLICSADKLWTQPFCSEGEEDKIKELFRKYPVLHSKFPEYHSY